MKPEVSTQGPATGRRQLLPLWLGAMGTLLLLLAWTRALWAGYLVAGLGTYAGLVVWLRLRSQRLTGTPRRWVRAGMVVLAAGLLTAGLAHWRFELIEFRWQELSAKREARVAERVARQMAELQKRGAEAARLGAQAVADTGWTYAFRELDRVRERTGVDGIVLLTANGDPRAWAGEHRGRLPDFLRLAADTIHFQERPLFSYLYFIQPVPDRDARVVSAVLIATGLGGEADAFQQLTRPLDTDVSFHAGGGVSTGPTVWALVADGDTVVQARLRPITQRQRRAEVERLPRRAGVLLGTLAFALFAMAFLSARGRQRGSTVVPLLALLPVLAIAPLGEFGMESLFSPGFFLLRPGSLTLGRVLVLLLPVAAMVAALRRAPVSPANLAPVLGIGALAVSLAYPGGLRLMISGATRPLLESAEPLWLGLQLAATLLLTVVTVLAMPRVQAGDGVAPPSVRVRLFWGSAGAVLAGLLALAVVARTIPMTTAYAVLWVLPFILLALSVAYEGGRRGSVHRWLLAGWLAMSVTMPHLWNAHVQARLATAESELATLGSQSDPLLEYLLRSFGQQALERYESGETGVQLLYRTYVSSGLAREGYQARISLWSPADLPLAQLGSMEELTLAEADVLLSLLDEARVEGAPAVYTFNDQPHMSRVLTLPLDDGDVITVVVPPRRSLGRSGGLAFLFGGDEPGSVRLNLVEATSPPDSAAGDPVWYRARGGWRTRAEVQYPNGRYNAHLLVPLPGRGVWLARAALLIMLDGAVLLALWALGVVGRGTSPLPRGAWAGWVGSFRARVTLALLAFFLLPTVVLGYVSYRALAREVERATQSVAARAAAQAVSEFPNRIDLKVLAQHAGSDVLRYSHGELMDGATEEALELGVYNAWMPPLAFAQLENGEERTAQQLVSFGDQRFVLAFHALIPNGALAVPQPLASAEVAVRQRELAHLIVFAAVLGSLLSLALSVAVGRSLAGPIALLRRASAAVGAGRLRVRLPENERGEFGQLFTSFNRMVRRLRRARGRELQSARVLAWGEMARQVAHEIKNPLTPIKLSVQYLRRAHRDRHPQFEQVLDDSVQEILREIDRLSEIARAFSRYGAPALAAGPLEAVDVVAVLREALTLYRRGDAGVSYQEEVEPGLPRVQARAAELKEVLLNLIENARAALEGEGEIVVRAQLREEQIELEIEDDGSGIAPDQLGRIFDPHFSTRSTGTGLGLAIVRRLVEGWGGTVTVDSRPGQGTTARLRLLPAAAPTPSGTDAGGR